MVRIVERALTLSESDLTVTDGVRSLAQQRAFVASGASKTMASKHLKQPDGFGHAVDLAPYIAGIGVRYDWPLVFKIAEAMQKASFQLGVPLRWGGAWNADFTRSPRAPKELTRAYVQYKKEQGKEAFIDGPHFEIWELPKVIA